MHLSVIKLARIPHHGATKLMGVRCIFEIASNLRRVHLFVFKNLDHRKTKIIFGKNFAVFKHPCKLDEFYLRYQKP
jgi:hypothetical protein